MKIKDVMTKDVLTTSEDASLKDAAAVLVANGVSGLPVCDGEGRVVGVLSEGDILFKEHEPERRSGVLGWIAGAEDPIASGKWMARNVAEAMTTPPITVEPNASVAWAARLMSEHGVNRLPVVQRESLVGIVTRADLVRAFTRTDPEIKREIEQDVLERTLWDDRHAVDVVVSDGVVTLRGMLETKSDAELLERLSTRVPGVVAVEADLRWAFDDTSRSARRAVERSLR
jgi:CBS domain-containing protein